MSILLLIAQTLLDCVSLRFVQLSVGEIDLRLSRRQLGPLQCMEGVLWKEDFPYKRAGEEVIITLECGEDQIRTGSLSTVEFLLADGDDRFDLGGKLSVRDDFDGFASDTFHVALDLPLVSPEPDML